jgi:hypothetical protein
VICCAALMSGATAHLFHNILKARDWTVKQARDEAIQGGLCLNQEQTILDYMAEHLLHLRQGTRMLACAPVSELSACDQ